VQIRFCPHFSCAHSGPSLSVFVQSVSKQQAAAHRTSQNAQKIAATGRPTSGSTYKVPEIFVSIVPNAVSMIVSIHKLIAFNFEMVFIISPLVRELRLPQSAGHYQTALSMVQ
jgi:hypothetical protein